MENPRLKMPNLGTLTNAVYIPAIKYKSGNRVWYAATIQYSVLGKFIQTSAVRRKNQKVIGKDIRNRFLDQKHKNDIMQYIKEEPEFTLPAITLVSYEGLDFRPFIIEGQEEQSLSEAHAVIGMINLPIDYEFECLDGNHRTAAIRELAYNEPEFIEGSSMLVNIVHEDRTKKIRQDFVDVNKNAKSTTSSINTLFNTREKVSNLVVDLIDESSWLAETTEMLASSVSKNSKGVYTVNNIRNMVIELAGYNSQATNPSAKIARAIEENEQVEQEIRRRAALFLTYLAENEYFAHALAHPADVPNIRAKTVLLTGTGIVIAARVAGYIFDHYSEEEQGQEIQKLFQTIEWSREGYLFQGQVVVNGKVTNSRESIHSSVRAIKTFLGYEPNPTSET